MTELFGSSEVFVPLLGVISTFSGIAWGLHRSMSAAADGVRKELYARLDKAEEVDAAARAADRSTTQIILSKLEGDVERLKRDTVPKEDMRHLEARLTAQVVKIESQVGKIDDKVDLIAARLGSLATLEAQSEQNADRLDRLLHTLESGVARHRIARQEQP